MPCYSLSDQHSHAKNERRQSLKILFSLQKPRSARETDPGRVPPGLRLLENKSGLTEKKAIFLMRHIAYYISGHGYGHAIRSIQVIRELSRQNPYLFFHIRTSAPEWFFPLNLQSNYSYYLQQNDVGTFDHDFHTVDKKATLQRVQKLMQNSEAYIESEVSFLQSAGIELVIGDIPPLPFVAAEKAGIPSVAIGNFSWDWIYQPFTEELPEFSETIAQFRDCYARADVLLRLPMHGDMSAFQRIVNVPLITRRARRKPDNVRKMLRIPDDGRTLLLVALREQDVQRIELSPLISDPSLRLILLGRQPERDGVITLPQNLMPFQELVNMADVVISKPGYGIVSECIANTTPLVYTSRPDFAEYDILVDSLKRYAVSEFVPPDDFFAGNWKKAIQKTLRRKWKKRSFPINGAEVAAGKILHILTTSIEAVQDELS